ncbi:PRC-barrel domain-containing protein [Ornithinimicrobium faecis]|uniref:PRC-barrel domain-containing protein n=1 Tax=Ornithinimicrobium faecis TaxID=2934158 RepID=A0ABY4YU41_9MICO|nr:PRC-barrel domain-containing protein [Ornithinimicrobium sp. HY1793]USQ80258.1 PRC-barrel domain-containing protein [Ornithinimicrobium sp. HY1793]
MITKEQLHDLIANQAEVEDNHGRRVGVIGRMFFDESSGDLEWVTVQTGLYPGHETYIPLRGATVDQERTPPRLKVDFGKGLIEDAPMMAEERISHLEHHLSTAQQSQLHAYYRFDTHGSDK